MSIGLQAPDFDPLSMGWSAGVETHVEELPQNNFQPHGLFRKLHTIPVCAESPVRAVTGAALCGGRRYQLKMH